MKVFSAFTTLLSTLWGVASATGTCPFEKINLRNKIAISLSFCCKNNCFSMNSIFFFSFPGFRMRILLAKRKSAPSHIPMNASNSYLVFVIIQKKIVKNGTLHTLAHQGPRMCLCSPV